MYVIYSCINFSVYVKKNIEKRYRRGGAGVEILTFV